VKIKKRSTIRGINTANPQCKFIPLYDYLYYNGELLYDLGYYSRVRYIGADGEERPGMNHNAFHADPIIFVQRNGDSEIVPSITYGENNAEPWYIWIDWLKAWLGDQQVNTSRVDAYVFFNSTFEIEDDFITSFKSTKGGEKLELQLIHGGFKAIAWNDLSCFIEGEREDCLTFENVDFDAVRKRVMLNPHYLRLEDRTEGGILMIVGDENSWFFSLPIAPPPLYFLAQGREKINLSRNIIKARLGIDEEEIRDEEKVRDRVSEVLRNHRLNGIPDDMQQLLVRFMAESYYYRDKPSDFVKAFRDKVEKIMEEYHNEFYSKYLNGCCKEYEDEVRIKQCAAYYVARCHIAPDLIQKFHATPQYRPSKDGRYGNYSYLDLIISRKDYENCMRCMECISYSGETYRCSIAWVFGLSLLVLLDSYIRFVKGDES